MALVHWDSRIRPLRSAHELLLERLAVGVVLPFEGADWSSSNYPLTTGMQSGALKGGVPRCELWAFAIASHNCERFLNAHSPGGEHHVAEESSSQRWASANAPRNESAVGRYA